MPEWYLAILALALLTALGASWPPLLVGSIVLALAVAATLSRACLAAARVVLPSTPRSSIARLKIRTLIAVLHLVQPAARLWGRIRGGLTPWRTRGRTPLALPRPRRVALWSESWRAPEERISDVATALKGSGGSVLHGGSFDRWDLEVRWGSFGSARLLVATEEYPEGKQLVRWRSWPRFSLVGVVGGSVCAALAIGAASGGGVAPVAVLAVLGALLFTRTLWDAAAATGSITHTLHSVRDLPGSIDLVVMPGEDRGR